MLANKVSLFNLANTASKDLSFLIISLYAYESWLMRLHNNPTVNSMKSLSILRSLHIFRIENSVGNTKRPTSSKNGVDCVTVLRKRITGSKQVPKLPRRKLVQNELETFVHLQTK